MKYHIIWNKIQLVICWKRVNTNLSFVLHWPNHQQKTIVLIKRNPFSISLPIPAAAPVHLFQILSYHAVALRPPAIHLLSPCKVSLKLIFWFCHKLARQFNWNHFRNYKGYHYYLPRIITKSSYLLWFYLQNFTIDNSIIPTNYFYLI